MCAFALYFFAEGSGFLGAALTDLGCSGRILSGSYVHCCAVEALGSCRSSSTLDDLATGLPPDVDLVVEGRFLFFGFTMSSDESSGTMKSSVIAKYA